MDKPALISETNQEPSKPSPIISSSSSGNRETPSLFRRKEEKQEAESETSAPKQENEFTQEALLYSWKKFGDARIENGAGDAEKLVLGRDLSKLESNEISILLGSQLEINILEKFEQDLVQYLRKELRNDLIQLSKAVKEQKEGQKLYTSQDKYDFMIKENPNLKKLKEKLGLDFEY